MTGGTSRHGEETISKDFNAKRYLYVVDLDPVVVDEHPEVVERYNPGRSPSTPCVFVGYAVDPHPSIRFANGFDESRNSLTRRYGVDLRHDDDCTGNATSKRRILARVERCVTRLRGQGWTVLNEPPPRKHSVYVLELDPVAGETDKVRRANPAADPAMPTVYVGQTELTVEQRIERHLDGGRVANAAVYKHFRHALPGLYEHLNPMSELESLRKEVALGEELRKARYTVLGAT